MNLLILGVVALVIIAILMWQTKTPKLSRLAKAALPFPSANLINGVRAAVCSPERLGRGVVNLNKGKILIADKITLTNDFVLTGPATDNLVVGAKAINYLIVGGGGSGITGYTHPYQGYYGGAGGGGAVVEGRIAVETDTDHRVVVGNGGGCFERDCAPRTARWSDGDTSMAFGIFALGGRKGDGRSSGASGNGFRGGPINDWRWETPGAGGAGGPGQESKYGRGGDGGPGLPSSIGGVLAYYGGGGAGGPSGPPQPGIGGGGRFGHPGQANTGGGAGAGASAGGRTGGSGIVIVRYPGKPSATGGTITENLGEGFTLHKFTKVGESIIHFSGESLVATIAGKLSGTGGFTWKSRGTLILSSANSYTGDTIVQGGKLALQKLGLSSFASVFLNDGGSLVLEHGQTEAIASLWVDGAQQPAGLYDASNSGGLIGGTGALNVLQGPN